MSFSKTTWGSLGLGLPLKGGRPARPVLESGKTSLETGQDRKGIRGEVPRFSHTPSVPESFSAKSTPVPCRPLFSFRACAPLRASSLARRHTPQGTRKDSIATPPRGSTGHRRSPSESRITCRDSIVAFSIDGRRCMAVAVTALVRGGNVCSRLATHRKSFPAQCLMVQRACDLLARTWHIRLSALDTESMSYGPKFVGSQDLATQWFDRRCCWRRGLDRLSRCHASPRGRWFLSPSVSRLAARGTDSKGVISSSAQRASKRAPLLRFGVIS